MNICLMLIRRFLVIVLASFATPLLIADSPDLATAVRNGSAFHAERYLRLGADPNESLEGEPFIVHAVRSGNFTLCRVLLTHGADPDSTAASGETLLALGSAGLHGDLGLELLLRAHLFIKRNARNLPPIHPTRPQLVMLAEPTVDHTHPSIRPYYYFDEQELAGRSGIDDDANGFDDDVYGWGVTTNRPHEINDAQRQLWTSNVALIHELVGLYNQEKKGEIDANEPGFAKLGASFRNPVGALFGRYHGYSDKKFLDEIVNLSHGTHVAGIIIQASERQSQIHTLSWDNFGPFIEDEIGYPPVTSGDPEQWLEATRKLRFPRLIAMGRRASDYLRVVGAGVTNASMGIVLSAYIDKALGLVAEMQQYDPDLPDDTAAHLAKEMYAYSTIPFLIPVAENPQILFVAAAGNDGADVDTNFDSPAYLSRCFANVISVAAASPDGSRAIFSNYGRQTVSLAAPGVNIESLGVAGTRLIMSGTSMAAPAVAGFSAGYRKKHPKCEPADLARLIQLGARKYIGMTPLMVSSDGVFDPDGTTNIGLHKPAAIVELAWRLIESSPEERPEIWADALQKIDQSLSEHPKNVELLWASAVVRYQVGLNSEALIAIRRTLEIDSTRPEFWLSHALFLYRLDEYDELQTLGKQFDEAFGEDKSARTIAIRRDIISLALGVAILRNQIEETERLRSIYDVLVEDAGRADGLGVPVAGEGEFHVTGHLESVLLPADEQIVMHRYLLTSDGSRTLQIDMQSDKFDTLLMIMDPAGERIINDDFERGLNHSRIVIEQPAAGEYLVFATSNYVRQVGNYRIDVIGADLMQVDDGLVLQQQHQRSLSR